MKMAGIGDRSMAAQLYKSLEIVLERQFEGEQTEKVKEFNQRLAESPFVVPPHRMAFPDRRKNNA